MYFPNILAFSLSVYAFSLPPRHPHPSCLLPETEHCQARLLLWQALLSEEEYKWEELTNCTTKTGRQRKKNSSFLGLSILKETVTMQHLTITCWGKQPYCKNCRRHQGKHRRFPELKDIAFWLGDPAIITTDGWSPRRDTHVVNWEMS